MASQEIGNLSSEEYVLEEISPSLEYFGKNVCRKKEEYTTEKKKIVKTNQSTMEKLHTHGDKIGRITLHPLINNMCVIQ